MNIEKMYVNAAKNKVSEVFLMKDKTKKRLYDFRKALIEDGKLRLGADMALYDLNFSTLDQEISYGELICTYSDMLKNNEIKYSDGNLIIEKELDAAKKALFIYNESFDFSEAEFGSYQRIVGAIPYIVNDVVLNMKIYGNFELKMEYDIVSTSGTGTTTSHTEKDIIGLDASNCCIAKRNITVNGIEKTICGVEIYVPLIQILTVGVTHENLKINFSFNNMYLF